MSFEETRAVREADVAGEHGLRCAACDHVITERAYRMELSGAHAHAFVNPGGYRYEIGCFAEAPGCATEGAPESTFSWFPGWSWQIAVCGRCRTQLGWRYELGGSHFHGLISNKLR
jgi:uncharacterized C2H2 Zn-finger protein